MGYKLCAEGIGLWPASKDGSSFNGGSPPTSGEMQLGRRDKKIKNARFVRVIWNRHRVRENLDFKGPTGGDDPGCCAVKL